MNKEGIVIASVAVSLAFFSIEPALAASFDFRFQPQGSGGALSFNDSDAPLTGIGIETVNLSQIGNANFFFAFTGIPAPPVPPFPILTGFNRDNVTFNFSNGELTGINLQSQLTYDRTFVAGNSSGRINGVYSLLLQGDRYEQNFTGTTSSSTFDPQTNQFISTTNTFNNEGFAQGSITFNTIQPVRAVPESSTILGAVTAVGIGTFFGRKQSKKKAVRTRS